MALKVELKPGEKLLVGNCIITNSDQRTRLFIEGRAPVIVKSNLNCAGHGEYLIGVCRGCHGADLRGGLRHGPDSPPSADISPARMAGWSREQLAQLFRQGKRRDGSQVDPAMPWRAMSQLTDDELTAIWLALRPGGSDAP